MRFGLKYGALLVICALLMGACGGDGPAPSSYEFDQLYGETAGEQASRQLRISDSVTTLAIECMNREGFTFDEADRGAASRQLVDRMPESLELPEDLRVEVRAFELQVAEADYRCRESLIDAYEELLDRHEKDFLVENAELVERIYSGMDDE
ncbi:MAG: hypothetical protein OXF75_03865 [Acidimicrobiaceae bacterium]|nr:hypothetical protein [Acidimicrobiaceae bacterium]